MAIVRIVVLNDGATFSDLDGCKVVEIEVPDNEEGVEFIESALQGEDGCMNILSVKKVIAGEKTDLQS